MERVPPLVLFFLVEQGSYIADKVSMHDPLYLYVFSILADADDGITLLFKLS
jgi:hypothetical protein